MLHVEAAKGLLGLSFQFEALIAIVSYLQCRPSRSAEMPAEKPLSNDGET